MTENKAPIQAMQQVSRGNSAIVQLFTELTKNDGLTNVYSGFGTEKDRKEQYTFTPDRRIDQYSLAAFYKDSALMGNIINSLVEDALSEVVTINHEKSELFYNYFKDVLNAYDWIERAWKTARENGGAVLLWHINDGQEPIMPVNHEKIKEIKPLFIIPKFFLNPLSVDHINPLQPLGYWIRGTIPEWYTISHDQISGVTYHKSRLMVFNGEYRGEKNLAETNSFGEATPDLNKRAVLLYEIIVGSLSTIADSIIQEVIKFDNFQNDLEAERDEEILHKLITIFLGKSVVNKIAIDKEDEFQYHSANVSGYKDLENIAKSYVSMSSKTPITKLFGESPSASIGSQSGGYEADLWNSDVKNARNKVLLPNLIKLINWLKPLLGFKQTEIVPLSFKSLIVLDPKTEAEVNKLEMEMFEKYLTMGIFTKDEIRAIVAKKYGLK